jgi:hypothetical protein
MEWEDAQQLAQRHVKQRGMKEVTGEMSCEELADIKKEKTDSVHDLPNSARGPETSAAQDPSAKTEKNLYIVLIRCKCHEPPFFSCHIEEAQRWT